jgi:hypothetical protein
LGPEGLGDQNDVDDFQQEFEEGENEMIVLPQCQPGFPNQPSGALVSVPEESILSNVAVNVISALALVIRDCIQQSSESGIISNVHAVMAVLQEPELTVIPEPHLSSISLAALAACCKKSELLEACAHLGYWLSMLSFACGMSWWVLLLILLLCCGLSLSHCPPFDFYREMASYHQAKYTIFGRIIKESEPDGIKDTCTLDCYFQDGLMTAALCGAGSFYMLFLMASSRIRPEIWKLNGTMQGCVAKLIHCPSGKSSVAA